jgi:hypothetical protein
MVFCAFRAPSIHRRTNAKNSGTETNPQPTKQDELDTLQYKDWQYKDNAQREPQQDSQSSMANANQSYESCTEDANWEHRQELRSNGLLKIIKGSLQQ